MLACQTSLLSPNARNNDPCSLPIKRYLRSAIISSVTKVILRLDKLFHLMFRVTQGSVSAMKLID